MEHDERNSFFFGLLAYKKLAALNMNMHTSEGSSEPSKRKVHVEVKDVRNVT